MNTQPITTTDTALLLIDLQNGFLDAEGFVARSYGGLSEPRRSQPWSGFSPRPVRGLSGG
jgi:hypothetical protein